MIELKKVYRKKVVVSITRYSKMTGLQSMNAHRRLKMVKLIYSMRYSRLGHTNQIDSMTMNMRSTRQTKSLALGHGAVLIMEALSECLKMASRKIYQNMPNSLRC